LKFCDAQAVDLLLEFRDDCLVLILARVHETTVRVCAQRPRSSQGLSGIGRRTVMQSSRWENRLTPDPAHEGGAAYREQIADRELAARMQVLGAVLIEGPKACGKSTTAAQVAHTIIRLDEDEVESRIVV
jgi:hypothetical protein